MNLFFISFSLAGMADYGEKSTLLNIQHSLVTVNNRRGLGDE